MALQIAEEEMDLPTGFRFHPTDEELITNYLSNKVKDTSFTTRAIGEVDLNKCEPWDLPKRAKMGEKEWYFFCVKDRKYPTGLRTNRATDAGYWKATGKDKEIYREKNLVGMKKTLVFYGGRAPRGEKTNWIMHEYRLEGRFSADTHPRTAKKEWVICRVFQKNLGGKKVMWPLRTGSSFGSELGSSALLPSMDMAYSSQNRVFSASDVHHVTCFSNVMEGDRGHEEMLAEYFNFPCLSAACNPSDSLVISKMPLSGSLLATQGEGMPYPGRSLVQLLESNGYGLKQSSKPESEMLSISQETELTTEMNREISSVVSNNEVGRSFEGLEDPPTSAGPLQLDECVWNY